MTGHGGARLLPARYFAVLGGGVRVMARGVAGGSLEFGVQQRAAGGGWGGALLPERNLLGAAAAPGVWRVTAPPPVCLGGGAAEVPPLRTSDRTKCPRQFR